MTGRWSDSGAAIELRGPGPPGSLHELARITGATKSILSRTLPTRAGDGPVRRERGPRGRIYRGAAACRRKQGRGP